MSPRGSLSFASKSFPKLPYHIRSLSADSSKSTQRALCVDDINIFPVFLEKMSGQLLKKMGKKETWDRVARRVILPEGLLDIDSSIHFHRFFAFFAVPQSHFQFIPGAFLSHFSSLPPSGRRIDLREYNR